MSDLYMTLNEKSDTQFLPQGRTCCPRAESVIIRYQLSYPLKYATASVIFLKVTVFPDRSVAGKSEE